MECCSCLTALNSWRDTPTSSWIRLNCIPVYPLLLMHERGEIRRSIECQFTLTNSAPRSSPWLTLALCDSSITTPSNTGFPGPLAHHPCDHGTKGSCTPPESGGTTLSTCQQAAVHYWPCFTPTRDDRPVTTCDYTKGCMFQLRSALFCNASYTCNRCQSVIFSPIGPQMKCEWLNRSAEVTL